MDDQPLSARKPDRGWVVPARVNTNRSSSYFQSITPLALVPDFPNNARPEIDPKLPIPSLCFVGELGRVLETRDHRVAGELCSAKHASGEGSGIFVYGVGVFAFHRRTFRQLGR